MNEIQYIGEHLLPGQLGRFAIVLGFVASLLAAVAYFFATQKSATPQENSWRKIGRIAFTVHGLSVFTVIGVIFYIMYHHYYEYQYVQLHVSDDLQMKYILSAFWEGQEGSFLLWMFWHVVLGFILIRTAKKWEAPVLSTLSMIQFFIGSMILGVYIFGEKIGSNPLLLLRDTVDAPIFANADYVSLLTGNGLNPLLQNYWMTIHPPTLFLGFAATAVPFCFAVAGLWTGDHKGMLKASLPWALFTGAILGTGILMGGAWAYEALTFGGYWAWDPVENASLVPWLILLAGIHTHVIAKATGHSIRSTYVFYLLTFFFILYSTFLTRSGVLGETSVHAFTEMGLENQLLAFILFFLIIPFVLFFTKNKTIPSIAKEEETASREFWMFIGALVLLFSACLITASTSLPIYNKLAAFFNPDFNPKSDGLVIDDQEAHHNKYQLWIAVFIGLLSGVAQFLRFKEFNWKSHATKFSKHLLITLGIAAALTFLATMWINAYAWQYKLLLFAGIFTVITNLDYLIVFLRGNLKTAGSVISHVGFGLMIVGILASGLNKEHISTDPFTQRGLLDEEMLKKNVILFKGRSAEMNGYRITYESDTLVEKNREYNINFKKLNENGRVIEDFTVTPNAQFDNKLVKVAAYNPDTKHYLNKDIFTHIVTLPKKEADREEAMKMEDSLNYRIVHLPLAKTIELTDTLLISDTAMINTFYLTLESINPNPGHPDYEPKDGDLTLGATIKIQQVGKDKIHIAKPMVLVREKLLYNYPEQINDLAMKIKFPAEFLDQVFVAEGSLSYQTFQLKQGEQINFNGKEIKFEQFNRKPRNPTYTPASGDIAVSAILSAKAESGPPEFAEPIYLIRGSRPFPIKDQMAKLGLHFRFVKLDPKTEMITLEIAQSDTNQTFPVEISTNSLRTDYIVFEAIIFPGINFFWLGSIMMMLGLAASWIYRRRNK